MNHYGKWTEEVRFEGEAFRGEFVDSAYAKRAGFSKILAVDGLPKRFEAQLARAAQVSDVPHTWRVTECVAESDVTPEILERGISAIYKDIRELGSHVIVYLGIDGSGEADEFLAAGAIRDQLTRDFKNPLFPVVSRAVVVPAHRGKGIGSLIVEHRMKAVLSYFKQAPKAVHFATDSPKIVHSFRKLKESDEINFVYIGEEYYTSADGTHLVHDYLYFLPDYQTALLDACSRLGTIAANREAASQLREGFSRFMSEGVEAVRGEDLKNLFKAIQIEAVASAETIAAKELLEEFFVVRQKIGANDPK